MPRKGQWVPGTMLPIEIADAFRLTDRLRCGALKKNDAFPQSTRADSVKRLLGRAA